MSAERCELGERLSIIKLSRDDQDFLLSRVGADSLHVSGIPSLPPPHRFSIELFVDDPKIFPLPEGGLPSRIPAPPINRFRRLIQALNLFKTGRVRYSYIRSMPVSWTPSYYLGEYTGRVWDTPNFSGRIYPIKVETTELSGFRSFWERFCQNTDSSIGIAARRFVSAGNSGSFEDWLIDLFIAFEALLLDDGDKGELSYRLALRGAAVLGDTANKRQEIFERLRKGYSLRSKIVHGEYKDLRNNVGLLRHLEDDLRQILRKKLEHGKKWGKELDRAVVTGTVDCSIV